MDLKINLGDTETYLRRFYRTAHLSLRATLPSYSYEKPNYEIKDLRHKFCNLNLLSKALESIDVKIDVEGFNPTYSEHPF